MVKFEYKDHTYTMRTLAELKFALMDSGELFVVTSGIAQMPVLCVNNLDSRHMVSLGYELAKTFIGFACFRCYCLFPRRICL